MIGINRLARPICCAALVAIMLLFSRSAVAEVVTVVSNTTDWLQSTVGDNDNSNVNPWPGHAPPAAGTFTSPVVAGGVISGPNLPSGATAILSGIDVRYFRTLFALSPFSSLTADVQLSVDNNIQVYVNGVALALDGNLDQANFGDNIPHRLFVAEDGNVTNGYLGGQTFDSFAANFPASNWNAGSNEIILAVRNLSGDTGSFAFRLDVTTNGVAVPEPTSIVLMAAGWSLLIAVFRPRRRAA